MIRSETNRPSDIADSADFEPFNSAREMFHIDDSFEEKSPAGQDRSSRRMALILDYRGGCGAGLCGAGAAAGIGPA
jgi:hypothetical protein